MVHNWRGRIGGPVLEDGELDVTFVKTDISARNSQTLRGMLVTDGKGVILSAANHTLENDSCFLRSGNRGQTWEELAWPSVLDPAGRPPLDNDTFITEMRYNPLTSVWYMTLIDLNSQRLRYDYYSPNDGTDWIPYTFEGDLRYYGLTLELDDSGERFAAGRSQLNNSGVYWKRAGGTVGTLTGGATGPGAMTGYSARKMGGEWFVFVTTDSLGEAVVRINDGATARIQTSAANTWQPSTGNKRWIFPSQVGNGRVIGDGRQSGSTTTLFSIVGAGFDVVNDDPIQIPLTWPRVVTVQDVAYHPAAGFVAIATAFDIGDPVGGPTSGIYVHYSVDGISWSTTPVIFTVPEPAYSLWAPGGRMRAEYVGDNKWCIAFQTRGRSGVVWQDRPAIALFNMNAVG